MPLFEFECLSCQHQFEELVLSATKSVEECPKCNEKNVRKLVSAGCFRANGISSPSPAPSAPACSNGGG